VNFINRKLLTVNFIIYLILPLVLYIVAFCQLFIKDVMMMMMMMMMMMTLRKAVSWRKRRTGIYCK